MRNPVNKAKQFRNIRPREIDANFPTTPVPLKAAYDCDTAADLIAASGMDEVPTQVLPAAHIDRLTTQATLEAVRMSSSWPLPLIDGTLLYNEPTWQLPAVKSSEIAKRQAALSESKASTDAEGYFGLIRNLIKNSGIYAISSLAGPLVGLLLAPFLTRTLSRTDYGAVVVLNTVVALVTGVSELGLGPAFTRVYSFESQTRREQLDALSTMVMLLLLILLPITTLGVIAAPGLSTLILGSSSYSEAVVVAAGLVLTQNLTVPGLVWLRAESRAGLFTALSIANLLITAVANIVLVGILHMGVAGSQVANGLGDVIIIVCTLPIIFRRAGFHLRFSMAGSMLVFGVPHVVNLISGWVLQLSDRYFLAHILSLSLAAGYSVAYTLGGIAYVAIIAPFSLAWWVLMYSIAKREDAKLVFKLIFRWFSFVLLFATLGLSLFGSSALDFLFPPSYHAQAPIIPVIAFSTIFSGIFPIVSMGTSLERKTWLGPLYFVVSALINVGLNIMLIPIYGIMGAAVATLVAYIVRTLIAYLFNQRIYPVPFEIGLFLVAVAIGVALYVIDNGLTQGEQGILVTWGVHFCALLLYGLLLFFLGWILPTARRT